ncbi:hypothetical protein GLOIN_2v1768727 [Rhizophagus irregularis DAOM 181602=DAOM 197198]|nr:hypothetical protein GLOIN_2v1768727 [Rhizophagus irregularis DAOM 181602=DAOM 197198]
MQDNKDKRPLADPCNISEVEFNGQCTRHKSEQGLARYERPETEIQRNNAFNLVEAFGFNKNNIRSDNFVVAKSLLNDNREVINLANT